MTMFPPEPDTPPYHAYRLIHDIYVVIDAIDRCVLLPFGITGSQYRLLTLLDTERGQRLTDLSDYMLLVRSTITRLVDQLEAAGLVHRLADVDDRRAQRVALTPAGVALRQQASVAHERSLSERLQQLTPEEQQAAGILLEKMRLSARHDLERREACSERRFDAVNLSTHEQSLDTV